MGKILLIVTLLMIQGFANRNNWALSLYSDKKGKRVGDVVTVVIIENAKASNDTRTSADESNELNLDNRVGSGFLDFIPGFGFEHETGSKYDGKGETSRQGELKATLSTKITEVFDNGNLLIEGTKKVTINSETETIQLSGIIRPEDITSDNFIYSNKIADAEISYSGDGVNQDASEPGLISRFFNWVF
ncbi:MAG: flagellar basal body L-ring protein FlgH [Fibrobacterales bacterium]